MADNGILRDLPKNEYSTYDFLNWSKNKKIIFLGIYSMRKLEAFAHKDLLKVEKINQKKELLMQDLFNHASHPASQSIDNTVKGIFNVYSDNFGNKHEFKLLYCLGIWAEVMQLRLQSYSSHPTVTSRDEIVNLKRSVKVVSSALSLISLTDIEGKVVFNDVKEIVLELESVYNNIIAEQIDDPIISINDTSIVFNDSVFCGVRITNSGLKKISQLTNKLYSVLKSK